MNRKHLPIGWSIVANPLVAGGVTGAHQGARLVGEQDSTSTESALSAGPDTVGCGQSPEPPPSGRGSHLSIVPDRDADRRLHRMPSRATGSPSSRRKAGRQLGEGDPDSALLRQGKKLPLGAVRPSSPAPIANRGPAHAQRACDRVCSTKIVDDAHALENDTICSVFQEEIVACIPGQYRHDEAMASGKRTSFNVIVGRRLAAFRQAFDLTQDDMADLLGTSSRQGVSHYENGNRKLPPETAKKIWDLYGISTNYFYLGMLNDVPIEKRPMLANPPEAQAIGRPPKVRKSSGAIKKAS